MSKSFSLEDELRLARDLAFAIGEAESETDALATALMLVCCATGWRVGQAWLPNVDGTALECSPAWYADEEATAQVEAFRKLSEETKFLPGIGLPGRVWQSGERDWAVDVTVDTNFPRLKTAHQCGLRAALGVPVVAQRSEGVLVIAVLEFFVFEPRSEDEDLLDLISTTAVQLGALIERKRTEEALRASEAEMRALVNAISDLVMVVDKDGRYLKIAPTNNKLLFQPPASILGKTFHDIFSSSQADLFLSCVQRALATGRTVSIEYSLEIEEQTCWFAANISSMNEDSVVWVARDITERKQAENALRQAEENYRGIFENAIEGIFQTDAQGRYMSANPALAQMYGYSSPQELMAELTDIGNQLYVNDGRRDEFARLLARNDQVSKFDSQVRRKDGGIIWISENARAVRAPDGELLCYEGTVEDITERKWQENQLEDQQARLQEINLQLQSLATLDGLTGLKNHRALQESLKHECGRALRDSTPLSVLLLDVDRFKAYNDSFGHPAGDAVLRQLARVLKCVARETDFVARYGGEEFAIVLPNTDHEGALSLAERFRDRIEHETWPLRPVTASVGAATYVSPALSAEPDENAVNDESTLRCPTLISEADKALYWSKTSGRNCVTHSANLD
jgi:diguanylate cyclase (GGDEF)-like protein/PAS domain S-box-containing protein